MNNLGDSTRNSSELLKAQAHIWNHVFNFINSMSLKCAIELGIPDIIHSHGKPITISMLTSSLSIHPTKTRYISHLMRILVHSGFFAQNYNEKEEEEYVLANKSHLLLKDHSFSLTQFLLAELDPVLTEPWHVLSKWFGNDDSTTFSTCHGMPFWDYASHDSKFNTIFNEGIASDARLATRVLINEGKEVCNGLNSIVDVGCGIGTVSKSISNEFPQIECIVLDLPHVVAGLIDTPNLKYVAGNMFESIPSTDAALLKWILHNWKDKECFKILENSRKAIEEKGGKVIIMDIAIMENENEQEAINTQLFFDMLMMMVLTGQERTEKQWAILFSEAGFSSYKIIPILG